MSKITDIIISKIVPLVDKDGDGKFTENDLKVAAQKWEDDLKSKQSNMFVVVCTSVVTAVVTAFIVLWVKH